MIDICFHNAVGGELLMAKNKLDIDYVFPLFLHLNYGRLSGDYIATQERMEAVSLLYHYPNTSKQEIENNYNSGLHQARECLKKLDEMLAHGHDIRVWANNTARDLCGLYWVCNFAQSYRREIFVAPYPENTFSTASTWQLTTEEVLSFAQKWDALVIENAPLRILVDDTLIGTTDDYFDDIILRNITHAPKPQFLILGDIFENNWDISMNFLLGRIDFLINKGVISVHEQKTDEQGCCWPRTLVKV